MRSPRSIASRRGPPGAAIARGLPGAGRGRAAAVAGAHARAAARGHGGAGGVRGARPGCGGGGGLRADPAAADAGRAAPRLPEHPCQPAAALARRRADPGGGAGGRHARPASPSCRWMPGWIPARCCCARPCRSPPRPRPRCCTTCLPRWARGWSCGHWRRQPAPVPQPDGGRNLCAEADAATMAGSTGTATLSDRPAGARVRSLARHASPRLRGSDPEGAVGRPEPRCRPARHGAGCRDCWWPAAPAWQAAPARCACCGSSLPAGEQLDAGEFPARPPGAAWHSRLG